MSDDPDDDLRFLIQRVARRIRANRGDDHLSDTQLGVLFHVHNADEGLTPGALADLERVTPPSMNRTVNCLEEAGLVRREKDADDARRVFVRLTDAGRATIAETRRRRRLWFSERLAELSPAERRALADAAPVLRKLADA